MLSLRFRSGFLRVYKFLTGFVRKFVFCVKAETPDCEDDGLGPGLDALGGTSVALNGGGGLCVQRNSVDGSGRHHINNTNGGGGFNVKVSYSFSFQSTFLNYIKLFYQLISEK